MVTKLPKSIPSNLVDLQSHPANNTLLSLSGSSSMSVLLFLNRIRAESAQSCSCFFPVCLLLPGF